MLQINKLKQNIGLIKYKINKLKIVSGPTAHNKDFKESTHTLLNLYISSHVKGRKVVIFTISLIL